MQLCVCVSMCECLWVFMFRCIYSRDELEAVCDTNLLFAKTI